MPFTAIIVNAATEKVISVAEAKAHLSFEEDVDYDEEDIERRIAEAQADAERECGRVFLESECLFVLDDFPRDGQPIRLPFGKCESIDAINYYDAEGTEQLLDEDNYYRATRSEPARVLPVTTWPATRAGRPENVTVEYRAGWEAASDVPADIKAAVKLILGDRWSNRGDDARAKTIPDAARRILDGYRAHEVA